MRFFGLPALLGILLLFAGPRTAAADYWWYYVTAACDPQQQRATFKFGVKYNEDLTSAFFGDLTATGDPTEAQSFRLGSQSGPGECHLTPDLSLRAKVGEGEARPYGQCGADPAAWLSIWVDRRKWLARLQVGGDCNYEVLQELTVTPDHLRICYGPLDAEGNPAAEPTCEDRAIDHTALAPDLKEFPEDPNAPIEGSVVLAHTEDDALCRSMIVPQITAFGVPDWQVVRPKPLDRELTDRLSNGRSYSRNVFDIDNDGVQDVVYGYYPTYGTHDADIYFAWPGSIAEDGEDEPGPPKDLSTYQSSRYAFPYSLGTCGNHRCRADEEHANQGQIALAHEQDETGAPVSLSFRTLHETPFLWKGQTYFLMTPLERGDIIAVLRPHPTGFDETCIFHKILPNF